MTSVLRCFFICALTGCTAVITPDNKSAAESIQYHCDNGLSAAISYHGERARLRIRGHEYYLYQLVAASGSKYATEAGAPLVKEGGLLWWAKASQATLFQIILDDTTDSDHYPVLAHCQTSQVE